MEKFELSWKLFFNLIYIKSEYSKIESKKNFIDLDGKNRSVWNFSEVKVKLIWEILICSSSSISKTCLGPITMRPDEDEDEDEDKEYEEDEGGES